MNRICKFIILYLCFSMSVVYGQQYVALVKPADKNFYGYVNQHGEEVLAPKYRFAFNFSEYGVAAIYDSYVDETYYIDIHGDTILRSNDKFDLINPFGGLMSLPVFSDSLLQVEKGKKCGFIDLKGKLVIEAIYDSTTSFNGGFAIAKRENIFYVINKKGVEKKIEDQRISFVGTFNDGLALFKNDGEKFGYINTEGEIAIEAKYKKAQFFSNGLAGVFSENGCWGFINSLGDFVIQPMFFHVFCFNDKEFTIAEDRTHSKFLLKNDGEIVRITDKKIGFPFEEGFVKAQKSNTKNKEELNKYGFIDGTGEWKIYPDLGDVSSFCNGFAAARKDGLVGFIDKNGVWVIERKYKTAGSMIKILTSQKENLPITASYTLDDILNYLFLIRKLDINLEFLVKHDNNIMTKCHNSQYLREFYEQDHNFLAWLLTFSNDTVNVGLWKNICKVKEGINDADYENDNINDARLALFLVNWYLLKDDFNGVLKYTFDDIKESVTNSNHKI